MRRGFRPERRDANEAQLVRRLEAHGCSVVRMPASELGLPDLLVGCARRTHLVEVKDPDSRHGRAGLSAGQVAFAQAWRGSRVERVTTEDEVDAVVARWRHENAPRGG